MDNDSTMLIMGEAGTGKESIARAASQQRATASLGRSKADGLATRKMRLRRVAPADCDV